MVSNTACALRSKASALWERPAHD